MPQVATRCGANVVFAGLLWPVRGQDQGNTRLVVARWSLAGRGCVCDTNETLLLGLV